MKLEFWYAPVADLSAALAFYRDRLGWEEAWREGETTVSLRLPSSDVQLMLDVGDRFPAGPMFVVDSLKGFRAGPGEGLEWRFEPFDIPGGSLGGFTDADGNVVYVMDQEGAAPS